MNKIITASAISLLSLVLAVGSVSAATISGNGAGSHNEIIMKSKVSFAVDQANLANFGNDIGTSSNTGNNKADKNTGGSVTIVGGDSSSTVGVTNAANSNSNTSTNSCCPCSLPGDITITGNGADSKNKVVDVSKCKTEITQSNEANIYNSVETSTSTGGNSANSNTGGDVNISSGNSTSSVTVSNAANSNVSN